MDYQQYNRIDKYLMPDEYVVWNGRSGKGHLLTPNDIFMIPFSILWCGFAIVWETGVLTTSAPFFFALWGIPFVCVGLFMVFGRFILKSYIRKQTVYVITNKRILFFSEKPDTDFRLSYEPDKECNAASGRHRKHSLLFNSNV